MKKILIIVCIIGTTIPYTSSAQWYGASISLKMCRDSVVAERFDAAIGGYASLIDRAQAERTGSKGTDPELIAEYAYALALGGAYDGALVSIDRARALKAPSADFYTAQILVLMSYPDLAAQFWNNAPDRSIPPAWLAEHYKDLAEKYKRTPAVNSDELGTAFQRANALAANKQYTQSIVLFQEMTDNYPDIYLPHVGYSTVWEKLGRYEKAAAELKTGIEHMDSVSYQNKYVFEKHLRGLHDQIAQGDARSGFKKLLDRYEPSFMLYAGGSIGKESFALNSRLGFYTNNRISASVNLGYSRFSGANALNIGVSAYKTINILVFGLGINEQISENSIFSIAPAAGLSFLNKKGNASYDILFNLFVPVKKSNPLSYSLSFGRTFYFNYNGKKK